MFQAFFEGSYTLLKVFSNMLENNGSNQACYATEASLGRNQLFDAAMPQELPAFTVLYRRSLGDVVGLVVSR